MGAVGGLLGLGGGASGTGFNPTQPVSGGQIQTAYDQNQQALQKQNQLLAALQGQGGLQKQGDVYNQLQGVVSGQGPNPAQAMLNQATAQNVANQAALMAGQRGAGSNVGLLARQAAQQGANLQQQAAGQGASMQAQQALGALGQAGSMANTLAGQQIGQTNANTQAQQAEQQNLLGAVNAQNQNQTALAQQGMKGQQSMIGGIMNGIGGLFADGGQVTDPNMGMTAAGAKPMSKFGQFINSAGQGASGGDSQDPLSEGASSMVGGLGSLFKGNGSIPMANQTPTMGGVDDAGGGLGAMLGAGQMMAAKGGNVGSALKAGGHVPGQAKVKGDSLKNDTVDAKLSPGEIVIPRSVLQGKNPVRGSAEFVRAILAKKR